jgi:hypothetical protein
MYKTVFKKRAFVKNIFVFLELVLDNKIGLGIDKVQTGKKMAKCKDAARNDFAMTMLLIFLLIYGAGKWSVDYKLRI